MIILGHIVLPTWPHQPPRRLQLSVSFGRTHRIFRRLRVAGGVPSTSGSVVKGSRMLTRYAYSPNQGILKSPVAEEAQIARERRLVAAAKRGCRAAFGELCQPCTKILIPKIQKITRNREDAEDALQDSFLRAFLHIKGFDGRSKF